MCGLVNLLCICGSVVGVCGGLLWRFWLWSKSGTHGRRNFSASHFLIGVGENSATAKVPSYTCGMYKINEKSKNVCSTLHTTVLQLISSWLLF